MEKNNPKEANNIEKDNNKMEYIMIISHLLKTTRLIFIILNVSYFVGIGWLIMCRIIEAYKEESSVDRDSGHVNRWLSEAEDDPKGVLKTCSYQTRHQMLLTGSIQWSSELRVRGTRLI